MEHLLNFYLFQKGEDSLRLELQSPTKQQPSHPLPPASTVGLTQKVPLLNQINRLPVEHIQSRKTSSAMQSQKQPLRSSSNSVKHQILQLEQLKHKKCQSYSQTLMDFDLINTHKSASNATSPLVMSRNVSRNRKQQAYSKLQSQQHSSFNYYSSQQNQQNVKDYQIPLPNERVLKLREKNEAMKQAKQGKDILLLDESKNQTLVDEIESYYRQMDRLANTPLKNTPSSSPTHEVIPNKDAIKEINVTPVQNEQIFDSVDLRDSINPPTLMPPLLKQSEELNDDNFEQGKKQTIKDQILEGEGLAGRKSQIHRRNKSTNHSSVRFVQPNLFIGTYEKVADSPSNNNAMNFRKSNNFNQKYDQNIKKEMESTWSHSLSRHVPDLNKRSKAQKKKNNTSSNSINHDDFDETIRQEQHQIGNKTEYICLKPNNESQVLLNSNEFQLFKNIRKEGYQPLKISKAFTKLYSKSNQTVAATANTPGNAAMKELNYDNGMKLQPSFNQHIRKLSASAVSSDLSNSAYLSGFRSGIATPNSVSEVIDLLKLTTNPALNMNQNGFRFSNSNFKRRHPVPKLHLFKV